MKKRRLKKEIEITIEDTVFPGIGLSTYNEREVHCKGAYPGQTVLARYMRNKNSIGQLDLLDVVKKADYEVDAKCPYFEKCGGCISQHIPYNRQVEFKEKEVLNLLKKNDIEVKEYLGIIPSENIFNYRNKMEYTFGDEYKDAPLSLGMHVKYRRNSVLTTDNCQLVSEDFNIILKAVLDYFKGKNIPYYRVIQREGILRNLIIREGINTKELMVILVSRSSDEINTEEFKNLILSLNLESKVKSIFYVINNSYQDAVVPEEVYLLYGDNHITEEILSLKFKITPFSFFQTNTKACETLYEKVLELSGDLKDKLVFDLYCGTGTIGNILAPHSKKVVGVEIIEEAALIARENSEHNNISNTEFIPGDVKDILMDLKEKPDLIILDPPRAGIHPKALEYALEFKAKEIIYVSCNPKTLVEDLKVMKNSYDLNKFLILENYPHTSHIETIVLMSKVAPNK